MYVYVVNHSTWLTRQWRQENKIIILLTTSPGGMFEKILGAHYYPVGYLDFINKINKLEESVFSTL